MGVDAAVESEVRVEAVHTGLVAEGGLGEDDVHQDHADQREDEAPMDGTGYDSRKAGFRSDLAGLHRIDVAGRRVLDHIVGQVAGDVVGDVVEHQGGDDKRHVKLFIQPAGQCRVDAADEDGGQHGYKDADNARSGEVEANQRGNQRAEDHLAFAAHRFITGAPGHAHGKAAHDDGGGALEGIVQVEGVAERTAKHRAIGFKNAFTADEDDDRAEEEADAHRHQRLAEGVEPLIQRARPVALVLIHDQSYLPPSECPDAYRPWRYA